MEKENMTVAVLSALMVAAVAISAAVWLHHCRSEAPSVSAGRQKDAERHYATVELLSSFGASYCRMKIQIPFDAPAAAEFCRRQVPALKNDILALDLKQEVAEKDLPALKRKIGEAVARRCPGSSGEVLVADFCLY